MGEARRRAWTCACGVRNKAPDEACERCGAIRPSVALEAGSKKAPPERRCSYDGQVLLADGYCERGAGYPLDVPCPFACEYCRGPLSWDGGCRRCHGSLTATDRSTWTFPGARYECDDEHGRPRGDGQHWVFVAKGPRPVYRPTNAEGAQLRETLTRMGVDAEAVVP